MSSHEKQFQIRVCEELVVYSGYKWVPPVNLELEKAKDARLPMTDAKAWDKRYGFYSPDIFSYLEQTQAKEYRKIFPVDLSEENLRLAKEQLLKELAKRMDRSFKKGGGLLALISDSVKVTVMGKTATFWFAQLPPDSQENPDVMALYDASILRVIHEVNYSLHKTDAIDLVITLNGLPIATLELKNGTTQTVEDAVHQYKSDRTPWAVNGGGSKQGNQVEPLLNGKRAIVHFAVDQHEAKMTTKLNGKETQFLPFNPSETYTEEESESFDPDIIKTDFLWLDVLERHSILSILKNFVSQSTVEEHNASTGKTSLKEETLFPRFHQWFGVSIALATTLREGPGHASLMMWSAGSGKSNGIAWLSHALSTLHYDDPSYQYEKLTPRVRRVVAAAAPEVLHEHASGAVFTGGGFVITDRTNLDEQISKTVRQKKHPAGFVSRIGYVTGADSHSKSGQLREELVKAGSGIKILTIQTFPRALETVQKLAESGKMRANQSYYVIRDEAHTSEGGKNSNSLTEILNSATFAKESAELKSKQATGELTQVEALDELMILRQQSKADHTRISYFAFTATPKTQTLERFGRRDGQNTQRALHTYSMQEAIDEGYILDVLKNYTTYEVAAQLVTAGGAGERLVDSKRGERLIAAWLASRPETLAAKADIIVEHFHQTGFNSLKNDAAQAMVFAHSRQEALSYKRALDDSIKRKGLKFRTLVAFSDELTDEVTGEIVTESEANGVKKKNMAQVFEDGVSRTEPYHFLVVADKYQTGYDNPRLVCGYIDKKISGVAAVQLLSRFNRTAYDLDKHEVYILDFANEFEDIQQAFNQFYKSLSLSDKSNPNLLHELQQQIALYNYYDTDLLNAYASARLNSDLVRAGNLLNRVKERWKIDLERAEEAENRVEIARLRHLPALLQKYVLVYGYQSTIINYEDAEVEKLADFYSGLYTALTTLARSTQRESEIFEFDGIGVISTKIRKKESTVSAYAEIEPLHIPEHTDHDTVTETEPEFIFLKDLISYLNGLFGNNASVSENDYNTLVEHVVNSALLKPGFMEQVRSNDLDRLLESGATRSKIEDILGENFTSYASIVERVLTDDVAKNEVSRYLLGMIWARAQTS